jgi:outer membrane receptor protein involved in Fe transport
MKGYDLKLIYGHAFVVPGYISIVQAIPGSIIDPQTIDTYELSLGADITSSLEGRITFFRNDEKDKIGLDLLRGGMTNLETSPQSQGVEVEARYDFGRGTYIAANFVYSSMKEYNQPRAYIGKIMSNIRLSRYLNLYVDCFHSGGLSPVNEYDLRDSSSGRTTVNATLTARKFLKGFEGLELRGSVYNLFDEDYASPVGLGIFPYGYPQPGVNLQLELKYRF